MDQELPNDDAVRDAEGEDEYVPVTFDDHGHVDGPFFHGTRVRFEVGDELTAGHRSPYDTERTANNVYFSSLVETAAWGAQLATALTGEEGNGHIYVVEPTGPFEDDPNVTNKRFPGNVTRSYRTRQPMKVIGVVEEWQPHPPDALNGMLESIARLREQGLDVVDD